MTRLGSAVAAGAVVLACAREQSPPAQVSDSAAAVAEIAPPATDSTTPGTRPPPTEGRLGALRDSLARFPNDPRVAEWLWETGTLMRARYDAIDRDDSLASFAVEHPDEYGYGEPQGSYIYNGYHFRALLERFPRHERADDAAFRLTDLPMGGECEGYVPCYIEAAMDLRSLRDFLGQYPESEFAPEAVRRANEAFTATLAQVAVDSNAYLELDPAEVRRLLDGYATTAASLRDPLRSRAQAAIDSSRRLLDSLVRSRPQP